MGGILHEQKITNFLKNIDNACAFDFNQINEKKLEQVLTESPREEVLFQNGTMRGFNRFCPEISFDCPETRRNSFFKDLLKMEFELREIFRQNPSLGERPTQTQNDIFQALSLNSRVFVNCFCISERMLAFFVYLKMILQKSGKLGNSEKFVLVVAERKAQSKIETAAKRVGVAGHLKLVWMDKTGQLYRTGPKGNPRDAKLWAQFPEGESPKHRVNWLIIDNVELSVHKILVLKRVIETVTKRVTRAKEESTQEDPLRLSVTVSGFYEGENLESIRQFLNLEKPKSVLQKGYSEELGYSTRKRWD